MGCGSFTSQTFLEREIKTSNYEITELQRYESNTNNGAIAYEHSMWSIRN